MFFRNLISYRRFRFVLLVPLSVALTILSHMFPHLTELWFSQGIYQVLAATYGRIFGLLPFSVSQFLIILFPLFSLVYVLWEIWGIFTKCKKRVFRLIANISCAVGVLLFMFTMLAGLNYARLEFGELIGLKIRPSSVKELVALSETLAAHVNEISPTVNRNEYGNMVLAVNHFQLSSQARVAFADVAEEFPILAGFVPHTKPIIYSGFMSQLRITGIYSPFTMEAHVNVHIPDYHIPAIMLHELAHFRGIMREDEANFIAWLVGKRSNNPDFKYSAAMMALTYTLNQLRTASPADHRRIMDSLCDGVINDFAYNWRYWQQFTGPLADLSTAANDAYLRANRQEDGVASYGRMVDLLLAYFR